MQTMEATNQLRFVKRDRLILQQAWLVHGYEPQIPEGSPPGIYRATPHIEWRDVPLAEEGA